MIKERWYIALLRGINISGKNKVPMANLKKSFEALGWSHLPVNARFTGFCVGMMGDVIFLLSVLCIKDSCRASIPDKDKTELVTIGIYRFSRTPAFLNSSTVKSGVAPNSVMFASTGTPPSRDANAR